MVVGGKNHKTQEPAKLQFVVSATTTELAVSVKTFLGDVFLLVKRQIVFVLFSAIRHFTLNGPFCVTWSHGIKFRVSKGGFLEPRNVLPSSAEPEAFFYLEPGQK